MGAGEGVDMTMLKTVGVLLMVVLVLYVVVTLIGILAASIGTIIELLVLVVVAALVYNYFKGKKPKVT